VDPVAARAAGDKSGRWVEDGDHKCSGRGELIMGEDRSKRVRVAIASGTALVVLAVGAGSCSDDDDTQGGRDLE